MNAKHFAEDILFFLVNHDIVASSVSFNDNLPNIWWWGDKWKMIFNPDAPKQPQEILFSRKARATDHGTVHINNVPLIRENILQHLGLLLNSKPNIFEHINKKYKVYQKSQCCKKNEFVITTFFPVDGL